MKKYIHLFILLVALISACSPITKTRPPSSSLHILASTTFLADIAQNVAGNRVIVKSLLPFGADPHSYQPTPVDVTKIADSNILILNGVGYESFIEPLLNAQPAGSEHLIITASDGLDQHAMEENGTQIGDPHMWLDPIRVIKYVENIRDGLIQADPGGKAIYTANADAYIEKLKDLDGWIVEKVNTVPAEHRLLVTNHEAMGYFAERYGFEITGSVIPSFSSNASPSAREMAALIDEIKKLNVPVIFLDTADNNTLAKQIADETGVMIVDDLHLESLTEGPPAATYIDMMKYNVSRIVEALK